MRFGSVCSGIEAASVAWHSLGWQAAWLSEIEPFPSAVLAHHYPNVPNHGDMTTLPDRILSGEVEAPDLFCGGTPCQAFSVAGLRKSLDDARGNLSLTFCEIANAIDFRRQLAGLASSIIFWENVPGVLNTKDNAFGCFLGALAGEVEELEPPGGKWTNAGCVSGPQRTVAWRVLDAQYFGVAQRRRRVFVVASARDDFDPAAVLFEFDGVRRDTAPSREAGKAVARSTGTSATFSCAGIGSYTDEDAVVAWPAQTASTLNAAFGKKLGLENQHINSGAPLFVPATATAITASMANSCLGHNKDENVLAFDAFNQALTADVTKTIAARNDQDTASLVVQPVAVRRLTPTECERLQGFPDNYTAIPWRKKPADECPDGPRYKALGNSWAVPVVRWIGKRIQDAIC